MDASSRPPTQPTHPARHGLRARLKLETHDLHRDTERSGIMQQLLRGRARRDTYAALLRNLYEIYAPLEAGLQRHRQHPRIGPVYAPALFRVPALANDLRALAGEGWATEIAVQPAALAYRVRLHELADTDPGLLVAHAYVRYLGDLSGGQIVHRLVTEQFRLAEDATRFYQFGRPADVDQLLSAFRGGLDAIPATGAEEDAIVDEAQQAFRRHVLLFDEIARAAAPAAG